MKQECESTYHEFCWVIHNFPFLFFDILLSKKATSCQASWFCHENHGLHSHLSVSQKGTKNLNILNNFLLLHSLKNIFFVFKNKNNPIELSPNHQYIQIGGGGGGGGAGEGSEPSMDNRYRNNFRHLITNAKQ